MAGALTVGELYHFLVEMGLSTEEATAAAKGADVNGDGIIDREEYDSYFGRSGSTAVGSGADGSADGATGGSPGGGARRGPVGRRSPQLAPLLFNSVEKYWASRSAVADFSVIIEDYTTEWHSTFMYHHAQLATLVQPPDGVAGAAAKAMLDCPPFFPGDVFHIGSTSVVGCPAKPIVGELHPPTAAAAAASCSPACLPACLPPVRRLRVCTAGRNLQQSLTAMSGLCLPACPPDMMIITNKDFASFEAAVLQTWEMAKGRRTLNFDIGFCDIPKEWAMFQIVKSTAEARGTHEVNLHLYPGSKLDKAQDMLELVAFLKSDAGLALKKEYVGTKKRLAVDVQSGALDSSNYAKSKNEVVAKVLAGAKAWVKRERITMRGLCHLCRA